MVVIVGSAGVLRVTLVTSAGTRGTRDEMGFWGGVLVQDHHGLCQKFVFRRVEKWTPDSMLGLFDT